MIAWSCASSMCRSIALLFGVLIILNQTQENFGNTIADSWTVVVRDARNILQFCPKNVILSSIFFQSFLLDG